MRAGAPARPHRYNRRTLDSPAEAQHDASATPGRLRRRLSRLPGRWAFASIRVRILVGFIGLLALAAVASVLVAREVLFNRLDERIHDELVQETSELRRLAGGNDPATGEPFGDDVRRIFRVYFARNAPSPGEAVLTFVDGKPFLRSRQVVPYRLDRDPELVARWGSLRRTEQGELSTRAGTLAYLAMPVADGERTLGVFVVAVFRDVQRGPFDDAITATAAVGLAVLLIGSLLAWRMAQGFLRPVQAVTSTARGITESDLTRRIDVHGKDEVAELAETFNAMLDRLDAAFSAQRRFVDDAGHELRTPLTIVRGHLELLGEGAAEREETLPLVLDELDRMTRMVDDMLLLATAASPGFLQLETVDVARLTSELLSKMSALGPRRWTLEATGRGVIVADRQRLTQAVMQLAENAAKHTRDEDEIRFGSAVEATAARLWVHNTGSWIPPEERELVFERFSRGADAPRDDGRGLGLSIVLAIAKAHRGRVELTSSQSEGTRFTIVVPLDQPEPAEAA